MSGSKSGIITPTHVQQRWHDMELGMFFHFDIPIYKQGWNWRSWQDLPNPDLYQPHELDTDQWMEAAQAMGAKYAVFVVKHCSGFCQWQTEIYPYGVKQSSWRQGKGDVVEDFVRSCGKYDIKPGLYASVSANAYLDVDNPGLINRGQGGNPDRQSAYVRICEQMIAELWSRYGDLFEVWFDGGAIPVKEGGPDLVPLMRKHQPNAIAFQGPPGTPNLIRWVGNERGVAPYPCWSTADAGTMEGGTVEKTFAGNPDGRLWAPGECDVPIRNHDWFWEPDHENRLYSLAELMEMYYASVGRNCNLLLNANPGPDGLVPKADFQRYTEFGNEIRRRFSTPLASTQGEGTLIELDLAGARKINHIILMEDIAHGERILDYVVEGLVQAETWQTLCSGECIGHKRIQPVATVEATRIRLRVTRAKSTPHIRQLAAYLVT
ncbi:MAG: alpha-L-fucosidase [Verrucomicrobia bacterium]|nr:alpha-L-fucosidase [Verrucomicrobiota bacterium]MBU4430125.1 alpha-L-fucosidase [Verrucomicrobiota bacterium]MCG2680346.1 alpha-L-fucosidase [Kiritimatiellia bacterium]